jgi:2-amino-4-hydroxy-6-hydroxymethyldihydropteridine diphosphokinase
MAKVILLLGGNENNTRKAFKTAIERIGQKIGTIGKQSGLYTSSPWGFEHPDWFLNQVLEVESTLPPGQILQQTRLIEQEAGRKTKTIDHYEARLIDIDILFIDNMVINKPDLQIPHPLLHLRRFTLLPLDELMAGFVHPVLKKTIHVLLQECSDMGEVRRVD